MSFKTENRKISNIFEGQKVFLYRDTKEIMFGIQLIGVSYLQI